MRLRRLELKPLDIPFTVAFRHASAERSATATVWVDVEFDSGVVGCGESCPREYVTGESLSTAQGFASRHQRGLREHIVDVASLRDWMASNTQEIDANPAAWCAIELAILDGLAKEADQTAERLLSLPELDGTFVYTAVVGDAAPICGAMRTREFGIFGRWTIRSLRSKSRSGRISMSSSPASQMSSDAESSSTRAFSGRSNSPRSRTPLTALRSMFGCRRWAVSFAR